MIVIRKPKRNVLLHEAAIPLILIVEGNPVAQERLKDAFAELGFEVATAVSGEEAYTYLEKGRTPEVIILGYKLPDMLGPRFVRGLYEREEWKNIPIVPWEPFEVLQSYSITSSKRILFNEVESFIKTAPSKKTTDSNEVSEDVLLNVAANLRKCSKPLPAKFRNVFKYLKSRKAVSRLDT